MRFRIGAALFGLGVLLLVIAVALPLYVAPSVAKLPYDLKPTQSVAEAPGARFMQVKTVGGQTSIEVRTGTLRSTIEVLPQAGITDKLPATIKDEAVAWDVYQSVEWVETGELINGYATGLALNRVSGAAVPWDGQWLDDSDAGERGQDGKAAPAKVKVDYSGQTYKWPFGAEKATYQYFDRDLRKAFPATFVGTDSLRGMEVYKYEQKITNETQPLDAARIGLLLARFAPDAKAGRVAYTNTRTFWVEPTTGQFLRVREEQYKELVPDVGSPTVLLDAKFQYTEETTTGAADRAKESASGITMLRVWLPIIAGILALLLIAVGAVMTARGGGRGAKGGPADRPRGDGGGGQADYEGTLTDTLPPASQHWRKQPAPK